MASLEDKKVKKPNNLLPTVDIGIFYGLKVLLAIGVVLVHTLVACYGLAVPSTMVPSTDPPIAPWSSKDAFYGSLFASSFSWLFHGVNVFWFMSGFLISYQLYSIPFAHYPQFLLNRLYRLYPLLIVQIVFSYASGVAGCSTLWDVLRALLFMDNFWDSAIDSTCSGLGWSLSMDMHTCIILMILFYIFDANKNRIIYILLMIFAVSWVISIYMFDVHCRQYLRFGDVESSLIKQGIDNYYPDVIRTNFPDDPYKYIDKNVYDPDNLTADQIRNQKLHNNYLSSLYFASYCQIGAGFFGAISFLLLLTPKISKYFMCFIFFEANYIFTQLLAMTTLWNHAHVQYFEFKDSIWTSILLGSSWKFGTLSVFCGMNLLLRMNNKYVNGVLNNRITRFLSKYTYAVYFVHMTVIYGFVFDDEFRQSILSELDHTSLVTAIFTKSLIISFLIAVLLYHIIERPCLVWRKKNISRLYQKQKLN